MESRSKSLFDGQSCISSSDHIQALLKMLIRFNGHVSAMLSVHYYWVGEIKDINIDIPAFNVETVLMWALDFTHGPQHHFIRAKNACRASSTGLPEISQNLSLPNKTANHQVKRELQGLRRCLLCMAGIL